MSDRQTDSPPKGVELGARLGPTTWSGTVDGQRAIIKRPDPRLPWHDRRSAFFGGQGLVPPFRPLVLHEALAWKAVEPARLLAAGVWGDAPFIALRHLDGAPPVKGHDVDGLLRGLLRALEPMHRAGVIHRDLRPANVLVDGPRAHILDLDVALVGGLGPLDVGSRAWRAPELVEEAGDPRSDLYALGRMAAYVATGDPGAALPADCAHRGLIDALRAVDPAARPRDLAAVAAALNEPMPPLPAPPALHPSLRAPVDLLPLERALLDDPWSIVEALDGASFDRWATAGTLGRLLAAAGAGGGERWLWVAAGCALFAERAGGDEATLYAAQAREALARSGVAAQAVARAIARRLDGHGDRIDRIDDLCQQRRFVTAARLAGAEPGPRALVAWRQGDVPALIEALEAAGDDRLARGVAAAHLASTDPARSAGLLLQAPADVIPEIVRRCPPAQHAAVASTLERLPPLDRAAGHVALALARGDTADAVAHAALLAAEGGLDGRSAACLALFDAPGPRREQARALLTARLPDVEPALRRASARLDRVPTDQLALELVADALRYAADDDDPLAGMLEGLLAR